MFQLTTTKQFKKDYKLCVKRGYKIILLDKLFYQLEKKGTVELNYKPHLLSGNYVGFWECHIQPDWLLIWYLDNNENVITLTRTGTHSDLF